MIYPVTIMKSRYGGSYSGGRWIAFNLDIIPSDAYGEDIPCSEFFNNYKDYGKGETPDEAYKDLQKILKKK